MNGNTRTTFSTKQELGKSSLFGKHVHNYVLIWEGEPAGGRRGGGPSVGGTFRQLCGAGVKGNESPAQEKRNVCGESSNWRKKGPEG